MKVRSIKESNISGKLFNGDAKTNNSRLSSERRKQSGMRKNKSVSSFVGSSRPSSNNKNNLDFEIEEEKKLSRIQSKDRKKNRINRLKGSRSSAMIHLSGIEKEAKKPPILKRYKNNQELKMELKE